MLRFFSTVYHLVRWESYFSLYNIIKFEFFNSFQKHLEKQKKKNKEKREFLRKIGFRQN